MEVHKSNRKIILVIILVFLLLGFGTYYWYQNYYEKISFQDNTVSKPSPFKIHKIYLFSSAYATQNDTANKSTWNLDVSQFTDIAIFIDNHNENEFTKENTIAQLYIDNIQYIETPTLGNPVLYYKNQEDFGKFSFNEENKINDCLDFEILPYEQEQNHGKPEIYDTSFSPICLGFVNQNIKSNYVVTDIQNPLHYDGSLLKRCNIGLTRIACSFSFDLHLINQLDEHFKSTITIDIPLKNTDSDTTIYDGSIKQEILEPNCQWTEVK